MGRSVGSRALSCCGGGRQGAAHCQLIGCSLSALPGHLPCPSVPQTGLNEGGKLLWIAPSGGRDRSIDPVTGGLGSAAVRLGSWWRCRVWLQLWTPTCCRFLCPSARPPAVLHPKAKPSTSLRCHPDCRHQPLTPNPLLSSPPPVAADDFTPDPFDATAVELMRALSAKAKPAGHLYPFTMFSYK